MVLTNQGDKTPWRADTAKNGPVFTVGDVGTYAEYIACFVSNFWLEAAYHRGSDANFIINGCPQVGVAKNVTGNYFKASFSGLM